MADKVYSLDTKLTLQTKEFQAGADAMAKEMNKMKRNVKSSNDFYVRFI